VSTTVPVIVPNPWANAQKGRKKEIAQRRTKCWINLERYFMAVS
jgi:hypothetical protein